jgi:hypothetical protein
MICQWTKLFQRKNGSHKISFESGNSVHFPEEDKTIEVEKMMKNIRYKIDPATKEIEEEVLGTFVHYSAGLGNYGA